MISWPHESLDLPASIKSPSHRFSLSARKKEKEKKDPENRPRQQRGISERRIDGNLHTSFSQETLRKIVFTWRFCLQRDRLRPLPLTGRNPASPELLVEGSTPAAVELAVLKRPVWQMVGAAESVLVRS